MTNDCRCGRPLRDTLTICDTCADNLTRDLNEIPWLEDELTTTIARLRALPTEGGSKGRETPLMWHEKAGDARRTLHGLLATWARFCEEEGIAHQSPRMGQLEAGDDNPVALSRWLLWRIDGLARNDIGPEIVSEIGDAVAACRRVIDRKADRWYAGPCVVEDEAGKVCGSDLYAARAKGNVDCRECGATYDVAARREWLLAEAEDRLANSHDLARAVSWLGAEPLKPERIRQWAKRGRIIAKGHDGKSPLYRIGDAIDLLASDVSRVG